jgi:hypothetical protein
MGYIETFIATSDLMRSAHQAGAKLRATCESDEFQSEAWRLQVIFDHAGKTWSYEGRLFRAPNWETAEARAQHQLRRLLGRPTRIAGKLSPEFRAARDELQQRIERVWAECDGAGDNLVKPGPIKVDWNRRAPLLKVMRFTGMDAVRRQYEPEFSRFERAMRDELGLTPPE